MKTTKWMKAGMLALLGIIGGLTLTPSAQAQLLRVEDIGAGCSGSCVDTWQVACPSVLTHSVDVRVRDLAGNNHNMAALNTGLVPLIPGNVLGRADTERSNGAIFSPNARVRRLGAGAGPTQTLAYISVHSGVSLASPYVVEFTCRNVFGGILANPAAILRQDQ